MKRTMKFILIKYFLLLGLGFASPTSLANNIEGASDSVWQIIHKNRSTAFFIGPNKLITALHVVWHSIQDGAVNKIYVTQKNSLKIIKIKRVIALSVEKDLALLETEESVSEYLPVREQALDNLSENVTLLGYPNRNFRIMKNITPVNNINDTSLYFNVDYANLRGASGGPVIDSQGQAVAVIYSANENTIVVSILKDFINEIEKFSCEYKSAKACLKESWDLLHQRAEEGNTSARYSLGFIYFEGYLLEKDNEQAKKWLSLATEQDHPIAQHLLGFILYHEEDYEQSMFWMKKAEKMNYSPAIYRVGLLMMREGSDSEATMSQFRKAKEMGHIPSVYHVAMMRKTGGDMEEAMPLFIQAGEMDHAPSQYELGWVMKKEGKIEEASYWFQKSEEAGYLPAKEELAKIRKEKRH